MGSKLLAGLLVLWGGLSLQAAVIGIGSRATAGVLMGSSITNSENATNISVTLDGGMGFGGEASASAMGVAAGAPVEGISLSAFAYAFAPGNARQFPLLLPVYAAGTASVSYTNSAPIEVQDTTTIFQNGQIFTTSATTILQPGAYIGSGFSASALVDFPQVFDPAPSFSDSYRWIYTRSFYPENTNVIRWTNVMGGSYFDPKNWEPNQVPVKDEQRADVASFPIPGTYTVDMTPTAGSGGGFSPAGLDNETLLASADRWIAANGHFRAAGNARVHTASMFRPSVSVGGGGTLNIVEGTIDSVHASIGYETATAAAEVLLANTGTRWRNRGRLVIGDRGPGRLRVFNGTVTNGIARVGGNAGMDGEVVVNGPDASWQTALATIGFNLGSAELIIERGGRVISRDAVVGFGAGLNNKVTVDGTFIGTDGETRSAWEVGNNLAIGAGPNSADFPGASASEGALEMKAGGEASALYVIIPTGSGASGTVTVQGVSTGGLPSRLIAINEMDVGNADSTGRLTVDGGALSQAPVYYVNGADSFLFAQGGHEPSAGDFRPSLVKALYQMAVQSRATLNVREGALLETPTLYVVNQNDPQSGFGFTVDGAGTQIASADIGSLLIGSPQNGELSPGVGGKARILNGALVHAGEVVVGGLSSETSPAEGFLSVNGATSGGVPSRLIVTNDLTVGLGPLAEEAEFGGKGTLEISNGARVFSGRGFIGQAGDGMVLVTGAGGDLPENAFPSRWSMGHLRVGFLFGGGRLEIRDGGMVECSNKVEIGFVQQLDLDFHLGVVDVAGLNSRLDCQGDIEIGSLEPSNGALLISDRGIVTCSNAVVGLQNGSIGTVIVTGASNLLFFTGWQISGDLAIAPSCTDCVGTLTLAGGDPVVRVNGVLRNGPNGSIYGSGNFHVEGGTNTSALSSLIRSGVNSPAASIINQGTIAPGSPLGTLNLSGNFEQTASGRLRVEVSGNNQCGQLKINGNATLGGTLEMIFRDNYLPQVGDSISFLNVTGETQGTFSQAEVVGQPYNGIVAGVLSKGEFLVTAVLRTNYQILHTFGPANVDGINGWGPLTLASDGFLYGATRNGGDASAGTLFRMRPEGYGYQTLRFLDPVNDGSNPAGGAIEGSDGLLYGTTSLGGTNESGTLWRMRRDGRGFKVLRHFRSSNDCRNPQSELVEGRDGRLYGTTLGGGGFGRGGVFSINKDGSNYRVLTGFGRGEPDAPHSPTGGLIEGPDGAFYGTTELGGEANKGTVFRMTTNGVYAVLKSLGLVTGGGEFPNGTLLLDTNGMLFGTTYAGGTSGFGTIFKLNLDGSDFTVIKNLGVAAGEGREPRAGLIEAPDGSLLGTTRIGGSGNQGTIFRLRKDGTGYQNFRSFGAAGDGARPRAALMQAPGGVIFGTSFGGGVNDLGVLFRIFTPGLVPPPSIAVQPESFVGPPGSAVTLAPVVSGSEPMSYQWRHGGVDISGATGPMLVLPGLEAQDTGVYALCVINFGGTNLSANAYVTLFDINAERNLTLLGEPGVSHRVNFSDDAAAPLQSWPLLTNVTLGVGPFLIVDPQATTQPQRFYRGAVIP